MVDTSGSPYYNDWEHAIAENYIEFLAIPGRVFQAREATQLQTIIRERQKRVANAIFDDGDIVEGIVLTISGTNARISAGSLYARGDIWELDEWGPTDITSIMTGEKVIGLKFNEVIVTEVEDNTLKDPALGYDNFNQPGCHRLQSTPEWTINQSEIEITIFRLEDGIPISVPTRGQYSDLIDIMARRTYDECGHYAVKGLKVEDHGQSSTDPDMIDVSVDPGKAIVRGYEVTKPVATWLEVPRSLETSRSLNEPFSYYWPRPRSGTVEDSPSSTDSITCTAINDTYGFNPLVYGSVSFGGGTIAVADDTLTIYIDGVEVAVSGLSGSVDSATVAGAINSAYYTASGTSFDVCFALSPSDILILRSPTCTSTSSVRVSTTDDNEDIGFWSDQYAASPIDAWVYNYNTSSGRQIKAVSSYNSALPVANPGPTVIEFYTDSDTGHEDDDPYCGLWTNADNFTVFAVGGSPLEGGILHEFFEQPVKEVYTGGGEGVAGTTMIESSLVRVGNTQTLTPNPVSRVIAVVDNTGSWTWVEDTKNTDSTNGWPGYYQPSATQWYEGVDFDVSGNDIVWKGSGFGPPASSTYKVMYAYIKTFTDEGNPGSGSGDWQFLKLGGTYYVDFSPSFRPGNRSGVGNGDQPIPANPLGITAQPQVDYDWYLARRDILILDQEGGVTRVEGKSDTVELVEAPTGPLNSLTLAQVYLPPEGLNAEMTNFRNQRLTMSQINKMRDRVNELEYNTALALMDEQAASGTNPDELAGILSDAFLGFQLADLTYNSGGFQFSACMDHLTRELLLPYTETENDLMTVGIDGSSTYDLINGGHLISAPLDGAEPEVILLQQRYGTGFLNINPYAVYDRDARLFLDPQSDNWIDITQISQIQELPMETRWINVWHDIPAWVTEEEIQILQELWRTGWEENNNFWEGQDQAVTERVTYSTSREIIDEAITYMREIEINIEGKSFQPLMDNIYITFDGQEVDLYNQVGGGPHGGAWPAPGGTRVMADANGEWTAQFLIPSPPTKFAVRTGTRTVEAWDGDSPGQPIGNVNFTASGTKRTIIDTIYRGGIVLRGQDPLAQTFSFDYDVVMTGIGLYFATVAASDSDPVTIQIREVINGFPGPQSFGEIIVKPSDIGTDVDPVYGDIEFKAYFNSPVYLEAFTEYCIVLMSDTNEYNMTIGTLGELDLVSGELVANQPYSVGVLFTSSNNSSWTTEQKSDLKFKIYGAQFDAQGTSTPSGIVLWNNLAVSYTRFVLAVDWLTPVGGRIEWEYSYDAGTTWFPCFPFVVIDAGGPTSGGTPRYRTQLQIRAKIYTDNPRISPLISVDSVFAHTRILDTEGDYISQPVTSIEYNNVRQTAKINTPSGTSVRVFFQQEEGGDWVENILENQRELSSGYYLYEYNYNIDIDEPDIGTAAFRLGGDIPAFPVTISLGVNDTLDVFVDGVQYTGTMTAGTYATTALLAAEINTQLGITVAYAYSTTKILILSPTTGWNLDGGTASSIRLRNFGGSGTAWGAGTLEMAAGEISTVATPVTDKRKYPGSIDFAISAGGTLDYLTAPWYIRVVATNEDGETTVEGGLTGDEAIGPITLDVSNRTIVLTFDKNLTGSTWNPRAKTTGYRIYGAQGTSWALAKTATWVALSDYETGLPAQHVIDGSYIAAETPPSVNTALYDVDYFRARIRLANSLGYEYNTPYVKEFTNAFKSI